MMKFLFTTAPILGHFTPERPTIVEKDASNYVLGCVLSQLIDKKKATP